MPLNVTAFAGIVGGFGLMAAAIFLTANDPAIFLSLPSFIIVMGGTLAATAATYSFREVGRATSRFLRLLQREGQFGKGDIDHLVDVAKIMQQGKLRDIEREIDRTSSPFIKAGLTMLADGVKEEALVSILH